MVHGFKILKVTLLLAMIARQGVFGTAIINDPNRRCYPPYGCFDNSNPWSPLVFAPPERPTEINTSFKLYNEAKPDGVVLDNTSPCITDIEAGDKIVVLLHGLTTQGGHDESMYTTMRPDLLAKRNAQNQKYLNVITVDYTGALHETTNIIGDLQQNLGNARLVAAQISYLLKKLESENKLSCDDVHIIGFSLGASIAGLVGKRLKDEVDDCKIPRITGLDPVLDGYEDTFGGLDNATKLHRSDAKYVDVIHTRTRHPRRIGYADFYPNGGFTQPGCSTTECHHFRAVQLFTSTILPDGDCCEATKWFPRPSNSSDPKRKMGFGSKKEDGPKGKYYLTTGSSDPYCGCSSSGGKSH